MAEGPDSARSSRLHRSNPALPGFARVAAAGGFAYLDVDGAPLTDPATVARIRALAIPPAWRDVWICPDPLGHLQATGVDAAGRRQYLYHDLWRAAAGPREVRAHGSFRAHASGDARARAATMPADAIEPARVLACSVRLLDVGMFRIGSEVYEKEDGHLGLATIAKSERHDRADARRLRLRRQGGRPPVHAVRDPPLRRDRGSPETRRGGGDHLLAFREAGAVAPGPRPIINAHLKSLIGVSFSAKNFRTWNGTLLAAVSLARWKGLRQRARAAPGDWPGDERGCPGARQHAGRRSRFLHRPARVRPLPVWLDDRRRAATHRRPQSPQTKRRAAVELPCSTCSLASQRGHDPPRPVAKSCDRPWRATSGGRTNSGRMGHADSIAAWLRAATFVTSLRLPSG